MQRSAHVTTAAGMGSVLRRKTAIVLLAAAGATLRRGAKPVTIQTAWRAARRLRCHVDDQTLMERHQAPKMAAQINVRRLRHSVGV